MSNTILSFEYRNLSHDQRILSDRVLPLWQKRDYVSIITKVVSESFDEFCVHQELIVSLRTTLEITNFLYNKGRQTVDDHFFRSISSIVTEIVKVVKTEIQKKLKCNRTEVNGITHSRFQSPN